MPVGSAFHARTLPLAASLSFRDWAGFYAVSAYEAHHEHEYNAIRNGCALIDISPLYKYHLRGPDAGRLVDRVITRDASQMRVGQVVYTPWCDDDGQVIDDGTVARLASELYRWTAADPNLRWLVEHGRGLDVAVDEVSEQVAALALQGPSAARLLAAVSDVPIRELKYFRAASGHIAGVPVDVTRTGYTGDLGYELWMPWDQALTVWDALVEAGRAHVLRPTGMLALDVARVEAGLLLTDVDFHSSRKATIAAQMYSPYELGLGRLVQLAKASPFVGRAALAREHAAGHRRQIVGLEVRWAEVEAIYLGRGLAAVGAGRGLARGRAGLQGRPASGEGDLHGVVTHDETPHRACHHRSPAFRRRHRAADRDHRGGHALHGHRHGRAHALSEAGAPHRRSRFVTGNGHRDRPVTSQPRARRAALNDRIPLPRYQARSTTVTICAHTAGRPRSSVPAAMPGMRREAVPAMPSRATTMAACITCLRTPSFRATHARTTNTTPKKAGMSAVMLVRPVPR